MKRLENTFLHEGGWKRAIPFVMLFAYCLTIYQFIPEMWDDFYFGSLSGWGITETDVVGNKFSFGQLLHFASELYQTRITRVLPLVLINAPLLRVQWLYRIVDSLGITLMFYCLYRFSGVKKSVASAAISVALFGLFPQRMYTEGAFWFGTALTTFFANALMFFSIFAFKRVQRKPDAICVVGCAFLSLLTCLMQEITAFTLCGTFALLILYDILEKKRIPVGQCVILCFSVLGASIICFGPGNFNRYQNEAAITLSERVAANLDGFITTVFHKSNMPFLIVLLAFVCYLNYKQEKTGKKCFPSTMVWLWSMAFLPLSLYYSPESTLNVMNYNYSVHSAFFVVNGSLYIGYAVYLIAIKLIEIDDRYLIFFGVSGLLSVITALVYSNYIAPRMEICFYLSIFSIILRICSEETGLKRNFICGSLSVLACLWLSVFWVGYANNAPILQANREILLSTGARATAGEPVVSPRINISYDHYFTPEFVYPGEPGYPDLPDDVKCIKEYYCLPDDVEIIYIP